MPHTRLVLATCAIACLVAITVAAPSASAQVSGVTCDGTETVSYDPGLRLAPQEVTFHATASYDGCISSNPDITSGTTTTPPDGITAELSCLNVGGSSSGTATVTWDNGSFSRYSFTRSSQTVGGQLITIQTGTVIEGEFLGGTVVHGLASPSINLLDCLFGPGITSRTGIVLLAIT